MMRENNKKQQLLLDEFYRREKIWGPDHYLYGFTSGIVLAITGILLIMPFQIWEGDYGMVGYCVILELMGMDFYVKQYSMLREGGENKGVYGILCFAPVSYQQFALYILKKLLRLCLCMTGAAAVCQVVFAMAFLDTVSVWNLLMPLLCCLIVPMFFILIPLSVHKRTGR